MIVKNTSQFTAINCCPCDLPACLAPSFDVEHWVYFVDNCDHAGDVDSGDWLAGTDVISYVDYLLGYCLDSEVETVTTETKVKIRFRLIIPNTFNGVYYRVKWDTYTKPFTPSEGTPVTPSEDLDNAANDWTWTGPGDVGDPDSWMSPWFYLDYPTGGEGFTALKNIRYWCYRSERLGSLPTKLPWTEY